MFAVSVPAVSLMNFSIGAACEKLSKPFAALRQFKARRSFSPNLGGTAGYARPIGVRCAPQDEFIFL